MKSFYIRLLIVEKVIWPWYSRLETRFPMPDELGRSAKGMRATDMD